MNEQDRATLRGLVRDHLVALAAPLADFDRELVPVLVVWGRFPVPVRLPASNGWQSAAEQVFQAARRIEVLSSIAIGSDAGTECA
jgi:hypothetical protein